MYERLEKCPSCQNTQFDNHIICEDHSVSKESFALVICKSCQLIFTNPRPKEDELSNYYQSEDYISHTDKGNSLMNFIYKLVRKYTLQQKKKLVKKIKSGNNLLDFGAGTGDFLLTMKNDYEVVGIEPDEHARQLAENKTKASVASSLDNLNTTDTFDVITAWHVIEHVSELIKTLKRLRKMLNKGGRIIVALPNASSWDAKHYKEFWAGYDVPRHLYHFTKSSFKTLCEQADLKMERTIPMKFDSYYVSMLSEKYQGKRSGFIKGLINGWRSNQVARKNGEYSSLIYVLKK